MQHHYYADRESALAYLESHAWKRPDAYGGFSPDGDFLVCSQHRDSDCLARSNYHVAMCELTAAAKASGTDFSALQGGWGNDHPDRAAVYDWRASHWAVGWVEYLMVRRNAPTAVLACAVDILRSIEDCPILDEDEYSEREWTAVTDYWDRCGIRERADYLREAGLSIFAARRPWGDVPDDSGQLFDVLREGL